VKFNPNLSGGQRGPGISSITCPGADTSNNYSRCTSQLIDTAGTDRPFITLDGRHVYIEYHDSEEGEIIRVQRSDDDGITWKRVGNATQSLGEVTGGTYYGTAASNHNDPNAAWNVYLAKSTDSGAHFNQTTVTPEPNHIGKICTQGSACNFADRTLADLFEIAIDPQNRLVAIAYVSDTVGAPFRITSGPHQGTNASAETVFTKSILTFPGALMKGSTTYLGEPCPGDPVPHAVDDGDPTTQSIAVIGPGGGVSGNCFIQDKAQAALEAGYDGFVEIAGGETVFPAISNSYRDIPGEVIGNATGLAIFNAGSQSELTVGESGASISVGRLRAQTVLAQEAP
jgi:hypothetical protein